MPAPLRSMTGFARVRRPLGDGELVVSVKSVNHRGLDLVIQAPSALDPFESAIRALVKASVVRGHVEVRVSLPKTRERRRGAGAQSRIPARVSAHLPRRGRGARSRFEAGSERGAADPRHVRGRRKRRPAGGSRAARSEALAAALDELNEFRAREGARSPRKCAATTSA